MTNLKDLVRFLRASDAIMDKVGIAEAYRPATAVAGGVRIGDDCAAIACDDAYLLFGAEGMLDEFVAEDPWFAGYSAVMVNISDVVAMGGRPLALTDVIWTANHEMAAEVWAGMTAASTAYDVPIVGGHTTLTPSSGSTRLAVSIVGRARSLLTSFDAVPGDRLVMVVDLDGSFRRNKPFWNASTSCAPERLRRLMTLLPQIAEDGLCCAAKDISNGGVIGTLAMFLQASNVGATLRLEDLPRPHDVDMRKWLLSFPSYGFLLAVRPEATKSVCSVFIDAGVASACVGDLDDSGALTLQADGDSEVFWVCADREESVLA